MKAVLHFSGVSILFLPGACSLYWPGTREAVDLAGKSRWALANRRSADGFTVWHLSIKHKGVFVRYCRNFAIFLAIAIGAAGCASSNKKTNGAPGAAVEESRIEGNFPAGSPFAKIQLGMSQGQVHSILGQPTDTISYQTGKMWIPFYFGRDVMRFEELYKGVGRIVYTGAGIGGVNWKVYRATYDATEDGYPDPKK